MWTATEESTNLGMYYVKNTSEGMNNLPEDICKWELVA